MRHSRVRHDLFNCELVPSRNRAGARSGSQPFHTELLSRTPRHSHSHRDTGRSSAEGTGRGSSTGAGVETSSPRDTHATHTGHTGTRITQPNLTTIPTHQRTHTHSHDRVPVLGALVRLMVVQDGCEVRLCDPCPRVSPCVPCVSRLPRCLFTGTVPGQYAECSCNQL